MDNKSKDLLREFLKSHNEEVWTLSNDDLKEALQTS
jgi:hypothetical protein